MRRYTAFIPLLLLGALGCRLDRDNPKHDPPPLISSGGAGGGTSPPATFQLVSPPSGVSGETMTPLLAWTDGVGETAYRLEISADVGFSSIVYSNSGLPADVTQFLVPAGILSSDTLYYWRVTALTPATQLPASNGPFALQVSGWARSYGGSGPDDASCVDVATDQGYVVTERTASFGNPASDLWLLKLGRTGGIDWQKAYGAVKTDRALSVRRIAAGGYYVAGFSNSFGAGPYDFWVLKLGDDGSIVWQNTYGGGSHDFGQSLVPTQDGGCVVGGYTTSFGAGANDMWVLKLAADGTVEWQKTYGGPLNDYLFAVEQTSDGGYLLVGRTESTGAGSYDAWVLKLNSDGTIVWQKTYGGGGIEYARAAHEVSFGGYVVAGYSDSFGAGGYDFWVLRLNPDGTIAWQKTYGGTSSDQAFSVDETTDGRVVVAGHTLSFGSGLTDAWILKLNPDGTVDWQRTFGGSQEDYVTSIRQVPSGELVAAGRTQSFGSGMTDIWVLRLNPSGTLPPLGGTTSIIPTDSSGTSTDSSVTGSNTSIVASGTSVVPQVTAATVQSQAP